MTTLSEQMSRLSGVPLLDTAQETPTEYSRASELGKALKQESVIGLYWCQPKACLVIQTVSGKRIGIPKISLYHPLAEIVETPEGPRLAQKTYVESVAKLIRQKRPN